MSSEGFLAVIAKSIVESGHLVVACFSGVVTMREIEEYFY
jgi:hypothetical protein